MADKTEAMLAWEAHNKELRRRWLPVIGVALVVLVAAIWYLSSKGLQSQTYSYVQNIYDQTDVLGRLIAICTGAAIALLVAKPTKVRTVGEPSKNYRVFWIIGIIIGLIMGILPGLILLLIYFLEHRATQRLPQAGASAQKFFIPKISNWWVLGAFILGLIPGYILFVLLTYPLSTHACRLSGSKYC